MVKTLLFYLLLFSSLLAFPSTHLYFVIFTSFSLFFPEPKTQPAFFIFPLQERTRQAPEGMGSGWSFFLASGMTSHSLPLNY